MYLTLPFPIPCGLYALFFTINKVSFYAFLAVVIPLRKPLRTWVRKTERDSGLHPGTTSLEHERIKALSSKVMCLYFFCHATFFHERMLHLVFAPAFLKTGGAQKNAGH